MGWSRIRSAVFLLSMVSPPVQSQLWTGSVGEPVHWVTFGAGAVADPLFQAANTTYTPAGGCPGNDAYSVSNLTFGCLGGGWHSPITADNTPDDAGGKLMLVNGTGTQGTVYTGTVTGLCADTRYEFSAFLMNLVRPGVLSGAILPNLLFTVEATGVGILASHSTNGIPETNALTWRQYGTTFVTPPGVTSVTLRITSQAGAGNGNDFAVDDIVLRPCGPSVTAAILPDGTDFLGICENDARSFLLQATVGNGYANPKMQWQVSDDNGRTWSDIPGATGPSHLRTPTAVGNYHYRLAVGETATFPNPKCRTHSRRMNILVNPPPFVQATSYVYGCFGTKVDMLATGGSTYKWTGPNGFTAEIPNPSIPFVRFENEGRYDVTVTSLFGCSNSTGFELKVLPAVDLTVSPEQSICEGSSVRLSAGGGDIYRWEPSTGLSNQAVADPLASPTDTTTYRLIVVKEHRDGSVTATCFDTASVRVNVWKAPKADAGRDIKTLQGRPVTLEGRASGTDIDIRWRSPEPIDRPDLLWPTVDPKATRPAVSRRSSVAARAKNSASLGLAWG